MTLPPASEHWSDESNVIHDPETVLMDRWRDPESGVKVLRLTSRPFLNSHIYPETPVSMPDGKRFIFRRTNPFTRETRYWIADLDTRRIREVTDEPQASPPIITPDGRSWIYRAGRRIIRMDPQTFEREELFAIPPDVGEVSGGDTISHCGTRILVACRRRADRGGVAMVDLARRSAAVVFEHPDCRNAHSQYSLGKSYRLVVQVNDGIQFDAAGNRTRLVGENGASLWTGYDDGAGWERLNAGGTRLEHVQGHECWVGREERLILTLHARRSESDPWLQGRIVTMAPGDKKYRVVAEGEGFTHIHSSPDGRWWISDCNRTARVYVGSIRTGRYKLFVNTGATFGGAQETHPHPFFLADGRTVGWNSDATGIPHVYAARIPEGFMDGLE